MHKNAIGYITSLGLLVLALAGPSASRASYVGPSGTTFPPLDGWYASTGQGVMAFPMGITIKDVKLWQFTASWTPPPPGVTDIHDLGVQMDGSISVDGLNYYNFSMSGPMRFSIYGGGGGGGILNYSTEMLSLDLSGTAFGGPVAIRESPVRSSPGTTTYTELGGGICRIESFFDIWTELSLDNGMTWYPDQNAPLHIELMPEPSTFALVSLGAAALAIFRRRR